MRIHNNITHHEHIIKTKTTKTTSKHLMAEFVGLIIAQVIGEVVINGIVYGISRSCTASRKPVPRKRYPKTRNASACAASRCDQGTSSPADAFPNFFYHHREKSDTIEQLSKVYGVSATQIMAANGLANRDIDHLTLLLIPTA